MDEKLERDYLNILRKIADEDDYSPETLQEATRLSRARLHELMVSRGLIPSNKDMTTDVEKG